MTDNKDTAADWQVFDIPNLMKLVDGGEPRLHEFLRSSSLSLAVYRLPAGSKDMQSPHEEDEVYIVLEGRGHLSLEGKNEAIARGKILFVKAGTEHSFFDIEEDLTVLAIFGPVMDEFGNLVASA